MTMSRRELLLSGAASVALAGAPMPFSRGAVDRSAWRLPEKGPMRVVEHEWITMTDGVRLAARLWIPKDAEHRPVPVVFEYLPYRLWDDLRWRDDKTGVNLAPYGIAFVRVDIRGTGNSEGVMVDEYDVPELTDGITIIAWLARQPWSNGAVGMRGISWGGINALQVAALQPPELKAIMPMACIVDRYTDDAHYLGGGYGEENMGWGTSFKGHMAAPPDPQVVGERWEALWRERLAATPPIMRIWTQHQRYDAYWKRGSPAMDFGAIKVPVYVVDGWGDPYSSIIGDLLAKLSVPRKGLIGPWGHLFPNLATPLGLDWPHEEVRWWQQWLGGRHTGIMDEPMLRVYVMDQADSQAFPKEVPGRWIAEEFWPSPRTRSSTFFFDAGQRLALEPASRDSIHYVGNKIVGLTKPQWVYGRPTEFEQSADDQNSLLFDTAPLDEDVVILGLPRVRLRVAADVPVAQVAVRLTDVTPDGQSWLVSYGVLNLTRRDSMETPEPIVPGQFYEVDLPLYMIAHRFKKGNRIRAALSAGLWPLVWPSPRIATLTIALGDSQLVLPVRTAPRREAPFTIPEIHADQAAHGSLGYANGLEWVKTPISTPNLPHMPTRDAAGRIRHDDDGEPTATFIPAVGTTSTTKNRRVVEITEGDPTSCRMMYDRTARWQRGDWDCTIQFGADLTANTEEFQLREWVIAKKGETEIFRQELPSTIKRDLL